MFKEEFGNIWHLDGDALCITTNGFVKSNGAAVMGRGIALEATKRYPGIAQQLGEIISYSGNHVNYILHDTERNQAIYSFPVKHNWSDRADLDLIKCSCLELMSLVEEMDYKKVLLPRPGCGNGRLPWEYVKPAIEPLLDDRVTVVTFK